VRTTTRAIRLSTALLAWAAASTLLPAQAPVSPAGYQWKLPPGFPLPRIPPDNPMTVEKVALGRHLFYDTRLSKDGTFSCATCHQQARAFADDKPRGVGVTGQVHPRGAMSLANVAYNPVLTWANPTVRRLEEQLLVPMFGTDPVELGLAGQESQLLERLRAERRYQPLFSAAFPGDSNPVTLPNVAKAIASFERTLLSGRSPYDRYRTTLDASAIPPAAHRGQDLFFSDRVGCFNCHAGFNFTQSVDHVGRDSVELAFHNTGLYDLDGKGSYPAPNTGVHAATGDAADMGKFRAPTLRNIALTAPYMHDGSLTTLDEVIAHYEKGGRAARTRASGDASASRVAAAAHPRSPLVRPFTLTADERTDLIAFLQSLTDQAFVTDPALSNPWTDARAAGR
jgi:cytochrome c peroxidase